MADEGTEVTQQDIESFLSRIDDWAKELPDAEQAVLKTVMSAAAGQLSNPSEVEGFAFESGKNIGSILESNRILFNPMSQAKGGWAQMGEPWIQGASFGQKGR